ncbi:MAG: hypothetical protein JWN40_3844 [Phycisphaerales bacterium]|nr:hypothetical protein [Phycisphaerales bacterium]
MHNDGLTLAMTKTTGKGQVVRCSVLVSPETLDYADDGVLTSMFLRKVRDMQAKIKWYTCPSNSTVKSGSLMEGI